MAIILCICYCFSPPETVAQEIQLSDIFVPPSANASAITKGGQAGVSHYTGTANIDIPICEIIGNNIKLPISLSYSASGIKVSDIAGPVGLGWSLQAGGVITRSVVGLPDETYIPRSDLPSMYKGYWSYQVAIEDGTIAETAIENHLKGVDTNPDIFNFNFGGYSGQLVIVPLPLNQFKIYTIPHQNIEFTVQTGLEYNLEYNNLPLERVINGFTAITPDGTKYTFSQKEVIRSNIEVEFLRDDQNNPNATPPLDEKHNSAWYPTKIEPASSNDIIEFSYDHLSYNLTSVNSEERWLSSFNQYQRWRRTVITKDIEYFPFLTTITLKNKDGVEKQKVTFTHGNRTDKTALKKIDKIELFKYGLKQKQYELEYTYMSAAVNIPLSYDENAIPTYNQADTRLILKNIQEVPVTMPVDGNLPQPYKFEYLNFNIANPTNNDKYNFPSYKSRNIDFWGYYNYIGDNLPASNSSSCSCSFGNNCNNKCENNDILKVCETPPLTGSCLFFGIAGMLLPEPEFATYISSRFSIKNHADPSDNDLYANRDVNFDKMKTGTLYKITYPTGGYTELTYEPTEAHVDKNYDHIYNDGIVAHVGGLRVTTIAEYDGISTTPSKLTDYEYTKSTGNNFTQTGYALTSPFFQGDICVENLDCGPSDKCFYYMSTSSPGKTLTTKGSFVGHEEVTEYIGGKLSSAPGGEGKNGKTVYKFTSPKDYQDGYPPNYPTANLSQLPLGSGESLDWKRGLLIEKVIYNANGQKVQKIENDYLQGPVLKKIISKSVFTGLEDIFEFCTMDNDNITTSSYMYLNRSTETFYDASNQNATVQTIKDYTYDFDTNDLQPREITVTNSDGIQHTTKMTYPTDYTCPLLKTNKKSANTNNNTTYCPTYALYENESSLPGLTKVSNYVKAGKDVGVPGINGMVNVQPSQDVSFEAGSSITLEPGFFAKKGGTFEAIIETCSSSNPPPVLGVPDPEDCATTICTMVAKNMHNYPIEIQSIRNNHLTKGTVNLYKDFGDSDAGIQLHQQYNLETNTPIINPSISDIDGAGDFQFNNNYTPSFATDYDSYGNIVDYQETKDVPTKIIWDPTTNSLPIAKIVNPDPNGNCGTESQCTFYEYNTPFKKPTRITEVTDPSQLNNSSPVSIPYEAGTSTYYFYDEFGRLKNIRDDDFNVLKTYEYHYK